MFCLSISHAALNYSLKQPTRYLTLCRSVGICRSRQSHNITYCISPTCTRNLNYRYGRVFLKKMRRFTGTFDFKLRKQRFCRARV